MDGLQFKWCLFGGLLVSSLGCHRETYPETGLPKTSSGASLPSMFGKSKPNLPMSGQDSVVTTPRKKGPPAPDTEVALAETHLQVALTEPFPPNRDELLDMARGRYQRALKQDPKHKGALLGIARMYAKLGDKDKAVEAYEKFLKLYPKDAEALHELAMKRAQWKDWAGAMASCEAALKLDPENRTFRKTLGFCQARSGKVEEAFATLSKIMPEAQARHNLAGLLDHMGQAEACKQQLQLALVADPTFAPAKEFLSDLVEPNANGIQQAGFAQPK